MKNLRRLALGSLLVLLPAAVPAAAPQPPEAFAARRLAGRIAVEKILDEARGVAGTPREAFADRFPAEVFERRIATEDKIESLLGTKLGGSVSRAELQRELDRIARSTRRPEDLRRIFAALGEDPDLVVDVLVRPIVAERKARAAFLRDESIHAAARGRVGELLDRMAGAGEERSAGTAGTFRRSGVAAAAFRAACGDLAQSVAVRAGVGTTPDLLDRSTFEETAARFPDGRGEVSVETTDEAFVIRRTEEKTGERLSGEVAVVPRPTFESFVDAAPAAPAIAASSGVVLPTTVEEGHFEPDSWVVGADTYPPLRRGHTAVWTGSEMIVWGGRTVLGVTNNGFAYDPTLDTWHSISLAHAPSPREGHTAIWTGSKMVIFGGKGLSSTGNAEYKDGGGRYDPATDSWLPVANMSVIGGAFAGNQARSRHVAVWTGTRMIVWGGVGSPGGIPGAFGNGNAYDPGSDTWENQPTNNDMSIQAPLARWGAVAVWTGSLMIVFGGAAGTEAAPGPLGNGKEWNPTSRAWADQFNANSGPGRYGSTALWTGNVSINGASRMVVFGGTADGTTGLNAGFQYDPAQAPSGTNPAVFSTAATNYPSARFDHTAVWTGSRMVLWGGMHAGVTLNTGTIWIPNGSPEWNHTSLTSTGQNVVPSARSGHSAVWTGSQMVVFGGTDNVGTPVSDFSRFTPIPDTGGINPTYNGVWYPGSLPADAPTPRANHRAVFTGSELVVFGGGDRSSPTASGGEYLPVLDVWKPLSPTNAPSPRSGHAAVWTGSDVVVWGGYGSGVYLGTGARWNPTTKAWTAIASSTNGRENASVVWAGAPVSRMLVFGGQDGVGSARGDGEKYDPVGNSWSPLTTTNPAPSARSRASATWTGSQMVLFGGQTAAGSALGNGGIYDPAASNWIRSITSPEGARTRHTATWSGGKVIFYGGQGSGTVLSTTSSYDPVADAWGTPVSNTFDSPSPGLGRYDATAVSDGKNVLLFGGVSADGLRLDRGCVFRTEPLPGWSIMSESHQWVRPFPRSGHTAHWTGKEMFVWGQGDGGNGLGIYYTDSGPTSSASIKVNGVATNELVLDSVPDTVNLDTSLTNAMFQEDVETADPEDSSGWKFAPDGGSLWHVIRSTTCSGGRDATSGEQAYRYGNRGDTGSDPCTYDEALRGSAGTTWTYLTMRGAYAFPISTGTTLFFHFLLENDSDAVAKDRATVEISTNGGSTWTIVATDRSDFKSTCYLGGVFQQSCESPSQAVPMDDDGGGWKALAIPLHSRFGAQSACLVRFGFGYDEASNLGIGFLVDDVQVGLPAGSGSIPVGTTTGDDGSVVDRKLLAHDYWDFPVFEWDFGQGGANSDTTTPTLNLAEGSLSSYATGTPGETLASPGDHVLTLGVQDHRRWDAVTSTVTLRVIDGVPPTVALLAPNGGEAWPAGSTQTISWSASDNDSLSGFSLYHVTEELYVPTTSLPVALAGSNSANTFDFEIPSDALVEGASLDLETASAASEDVTVVLTRLAGTGTAGGCGLASFPDLSVSHTALAVTSVSGNWDRDLGSSLAAFDGQCSGNRWRVTLTRTGSGAATLSRLRLNLGSSRTLIATLADGSARSHAWTLPAASSTRNRVEVVARDGRTPTANSSLDDSDGTFFVTQADGDAVRTLVVWNRARIVSRWGAAEADALELALLEYCDHAKVDGVLLDLSSGAAAAAGITAAYTAWDGTAWNDSSTADNPTNLGLANDLAAAIRTFLFDEISSNWVNLESVVVVGGDRMVPFFRLGDTATVYPETSYVTDLQANGLLGGSGNTTFCQTTRSPLFATFCANAYFSDTPYASSSTTSVSGSGLTWYLPDLAMGRLVETPEQIRDVLDAYLVQDGVTVAAEVATCGYDFLTDGADAIFASLSAELDTGTTNLTRLSQAVSAWSDTDLKNRLFGLAGQTASDLTFLSGHADHRAEGAAASGGAGVLTTLEMLDGTGSSSGGIVLGLGCHSGVAVDSDGGVSDDTSAECLTDLPELFAKKRFPVFVGNGGYGWGLSEGIGLGEALLVRMADEISSAGQIALGEAHRLAKGEYFLRDGRLDSFDHKVLHESILFGLPNYDVRVDRAPAGPVAPLERDVRTAVRGRGGSRSREERNEERAKSCGRTGEPWLGDPAWRTLDLPGGRKLTKSEPIEVTPPAGRAESEVSGASLRVLAFEYQAYADGQNSDSLPPAGTTAWAAATGYALNAPVSPASSTGYFYRATTAGTSGGTEPAWPTLAGGTIADGSVVWTAFVSTEDWEEAYVRYDWCEDALGAGEICTGPNGTAGAGQTKIGTYFTLDGVATGDAGQPIQPMISFDSKLWGTSLHGVLMTGGEYVQPTLINPLDAASCTDDSSVVRRCFDAVVAAPETKTDTPEGPAPAPFIGLSRPTPFIGLSRPTGSGYTEGSVDGNATPLRFDTLNAPMGESVRRGAKGVSPNRSEIYSEWLYRTRSFTQYYSTSSDWTAPTIGAVSHDCSAEESGADCYSALSGLSVSFDVPATDDDPLGIYKVYAILTSDVDSTHEGSWRAIELTDPDDDGRYTGNATVERTSWYLIQAVDWAGNIGSVTVSGSDVDGNGNALGSTWSYPRLYAIDVADTDADGLPDVFETEIGTNVGAADSDGDGIADAADDFDHDGISNIRELELGFDAADSDLDDDGENDGSELSAGRDPEVAGDGLRLTIGLAAAGNDVSVSWPRATDSGLATGTACAPPNGTTCLEVGDNDEISGNFRVYVSADPRFSTDDFRIGPNDVPLERADDLDTFDRRSYLVTEAELPAALQSAPILYYVAQDWDIDSPAPDVEAVVRVGSRFSIYGSFFDPDGALPYLCASSTGCASPIAMTIASPTASNRNESRIVADAPGSVPAGTYYVAVENPDGLRDIDPTPQVFP